MKTIKEIKNGKIKDNIEKNKHYSEAAFIDDAARYLQAVKDNRLFCVVNSVTRSGRSTTLQFVEAHKNGGFSNFFAFFRVLGFKAVQSSDYFRVPGRGMDAVFYTNHTIINELYKLDLVSEEEKEILQQKILVMF